MPPASALDLFQQFLADHPLEDEPEEMPPTTSVTARAEDHIMQMKASFPTPPDHPLTLQQQAVIDTILANPKGLFVIDRVAGSGKTHVAQVQP